MKKKTYFFLVLLTVSVISVTMLLQVFLFREKEEAVVFEAGPDSIELPEPVFESNVSVEESILGRRSVRDYGSESLSLQEVSQLLWAA